MKTSSEQSSIYYPYSRHISPYKTSPASAKLRPPRTASSSCATRINRSLTTGMSDAIKTERAATRGAANANAVCRPRAAITLFRAALIPRRRATMAAARALAVWRFSYLAVGAPLVLAWIVLVVAMTAEVMELMLLWISEEAAAFSAGEEEGVMEAAPLLIAALKVLT